MAEEKIVFCKGGGCTAKLGPAALDRILGQIHRKKNPDLLIGFEHNDDAAVYRISEDLAIVQTLDFFPPMVEDPYIFGQIAAANALSDIYAMGAVVKTALNIVCFPENMDLNVLGSILMGGNAKVEEAGGTLAGGHSIADEDVKYGLSVMGIVDPKRVLANNGCQEKDVLILTKPLGVGIVCTASRMGDCDKESYDQAIKSMTTLNKYASEIIRKYEVHACTDVTGFGFLVHLSELLGEKLDAVIDSSKIPYISGAMHYVEEFYLTAAGQRNRNHMAGKVVFENVPFAMEELLFDPQTSGGLLVSMPEQEALKALEELNKLEIKSSIVGQVISGQKSRILVQ